MSAPARVILAQGQSAPMDCTGVTKGTRAPQFFRATAGLWFRIVESMSLSSSAPAPEQETLRPAHIPPGSEAEVRSAGQANAPTHFQMGQSNLLWCLGLIAAVLVIYNPVTHNVFVNWDDGDYIINNPHVTSGITWATVKWAFTTYAQANWAPLS